MKKRALLITIIFSLIISLFFIYVYVTRPIKIGVILPVQSPLGNEENLYVRYFRDVHPTIGWRPVNLIIENKAATQQEIKTAYQHMVDQGVSAIIGGVISQEAVWLSEMSQLTHIPTFGLTASTSLISGLKDNFYRIVSTNSTQAYAVVNYYKSLNLKRLVILSALENSAYADPIMAIIKANFTGEVLEIPFVSNATMYASLLDFHPDSIFCILSAQDVIKVIKQIKTTQPTIMIGSSAWGSSEILSLYSSPILDGVYFFSSSTQLSGVNYIAEINRFSAAYHLEATKGSHYASSMMTILYDVIKKVGSKPAALNTYFETPRTYATAYGEAVMDEYGDTTLGTLVVIQTINGDIVSTQVLK